MSAPDSAEFFPQSDRPVARSESPGTSTPPSRAGSTVPLRFLQSSDFRLDTPCYGVADLPDGFRERFVDARYIAAERVFNAAIAHKVDFLVLAGGLLDAQLPGLRGPSFLAQQFRRLADHGIDIYWAGATHETRGRWPSHVDIPSNVHRLVMDRSGMLHGRDAEPIARLVSLSPTDEASLSRSSDVFTMAVQPRCSTVPENWDAGIDYWALGGQVDHETVQVREVVAHFAGSPQGRSPMEMGGHSCSLVNVASDGSIQIQPINTDVVRWHHCRIDVDRDTAWADLEQQFDDQIVELRYKMPVDLAVVTWTVTGGGLAIRRLMDPKSNSKLISQLNARQSSTSRVVWTAGIDALADPVQKTDWQQQQTPLGVYLRELDELAEHVHELFGTVANGPHPLGRIDAASNEQIVNHAISAGVHWLGTDERLTNRAI